MGPSPPAFPRLAQALGRAAVALRAGDAIALDLPGDKQFVVTVDGAENGAGVLNDLLG